MRSARVKDSRVSVADTEQIRAEFSVYDRAPGDRVRSLFHKTHSMCLRSDPSC